MFEVLWFMLGALSGVILVAIIPWIKAERDLKRIEKEKRWLEKEGLLKDE